MYFCPDLHFVLNTFFILYLCLDLQRKLTWPLFWQPLAGLRTRLEVEITIVGNTPHQLFVWRHFHNFYSATLCIPSRSWVKISWESFPFNLKKWIVAKAYFFFLPKTSNLLPTKTLNCGILQKIPQISATAVPVEICWLFSFSGRERNLKSARCGTRP